MITSLAEQANRALTGRLALVTGAGGGLGYAIARGLAGSGAEVIVHGRDRARLDVIAAELVDAGEFARALAVDLHDEAALRGAITALGPIDILVSNAGLRDRRPIAELDRAAFRRLLEVNLVAPFDLARMVAPQMREGVRIITISLIAGRLARADDAAYTATQGRARSADPRTCGRAWPMRDHGQCRCARQLCNRSQCGDGRRKQNRRAPRAARGALTLGPSRRDRRNGHFPRLAGRFLCYRTGDRGRWRIPCSLLSVRLWRDATLGSLVSG